MPRTRAACKLGLLAARLAHKCSGAIKAHPHTWIKATRALLIIVVMGLTDFHPITKLELSCLKIHNKILNRPLYLLARVQKKCLHPRHSRHGLKRFARPPKVWRPGLR